MRPQTSAGYLIALEGIDGSGTTTQVKELEQQLRLAAQTQSLGAIKNVVSTREPSAGRLGIVLRAVLSGEEAFVPAATALLFAADRLDHWHTRIEPQLKQAALVLSDRYVYSSLAYQTVTLDQSWVFAINAQAPEPDLTIYLRVSAQVAERRRNQRGGKAELYESTQLQHAVAARYDTLLGISDADATWQFKEHGGWQPTGPLRTLHGRSSAVAIVDGERCVEDLRDTLAQLITSFVAYQATKAAGKP